MKTHSFFYIILAFSFLLLNTTILRAQKFSASRYWEMEHDSLYMLLQGRQKTGDSLNRDETEYLQAHKLKLDAWFEQMTDDEKSYYYKNRSTWNKFPTLTGEEMDHVFSGNRSTFTKYVVSSGVYGFLYGVTGCYVLGFNDPAAIGVPFITAGISAIVPVATIKDRKVTTNSLVLSQHGKSIGAAQGAMLGLVFTGNRNNEEGAMKFIFGLSTFSSIALGKVGFNLGSDKPWSPGRASLYTHYGWLMPLEGVSLMALTEAENPGYYGAASLLFGTAGYLLADRIADRNIFTRGDVVSFQSLTMLNLMLGAGILIDIEPDKGWPFAIPGALGLAGTLIGQSWLKDAGFTTQQGWNSLLIAGGGSAIGFGLSMVFSEEPNRLQYILPYVTGFISYATAVTHYKRENRYSNTVSRSDSPWQINIMPQNIIINQKLAVKGVVKAGGNISYLPAISASLVF